MSVSTAVAMGTSLQNADQGNSNNKLASEEVQADPHFPEMTDLKPCFEGSECLIKPLNGQLIAFSPLWYSLAKMKKITQRFLRPVPEDIQPAHAQYPSSFILGSP